jgi:alanine dehydrogenase
VIFGSGTVSQNACSVAVALGAEVTVLARNLADMRRIDERWPGRVRTLLLSRSQLESAIAGADVLISGVLARGGAVAPKLVTRNDLRLVGPGGVIVDVSIDQGGIFETSRATTHLDPVYVEEGVVHYCVANMPGAVPHTSTNALTAATLPYVLELAASGSEAATAKNAALARGLMTRDGELINRAVAAGR